MANTSTARSPLPHSIERAHLGAARLQHLGLAMVAVMAFSGQVKQISLVDLIPGNFTATITILALTVAVAFNLTSGGFRLERPTLIVALIIIMALLGSVELVATPYGEEKLFRLFAVLIPAIVATSLLVRDRNDFALLIRYATIVAVTISVWIAVTGVREFDPSNGRLTSAIGSTISFAQAAGFVLTCLIGLLLVTPRPSIRWLLGIGIAIGIHAWTMLAIGSRGPIQALIVAVATMLLVSAHRAGRRWVTRTLRISIVCVAALAFVWSRVPERGRDRVLLFTEGESADLRLEGWQWTIDRLGFSPIGGGWGSWTRDTSVPLSYPHSVFLEVWYEAGVLGLVALIAALWIVFRYQWNTIPEDRAVATVTLGVLMFWISAALVSSDINGNKPLFVMVTAAAARTAKSEFAIRDLARATIPLPIGYTFSSPRPRGRHPLQRDRGASVG